MPEVKRLGFLRPFAAARLPTSWAIRESRLRCVSPKPLEPNVGIREITLNSRGLVVAFHMVDEIDALGSLLGREWIASSFRVNRA